MASPKFIVLLFMVLALGILSGCQGGIEDLMSKEKRPLPENLLKKIEAKGMAVGSPMLIRIFKSESTLEVWKAKNTGRYALLETYDICKWSGKLGPKYKEGDRQAPEGFYTVNPAQMNPKSSYYLSFNMGFPNRYDRAHGRTGTHLMVHGACSSAGCYSMTDEYVQEVYTLARESFKGGQRAFQIQAYPFRMTPENMVKHVDHPQFEFWKMLKEGSDHFEVSRIPPKVDVCEKRYVFNRTADNENKFNSSAECPASATSKSLALAFNSKQSQDQKLFDEILTKQAQSPFVAKEEKPKNTSASILADPTIGPLRVIEPVKPELAIKPETEIDTATIDQSGKEANLSGSKRVAGVATEPGTTILLDPLSKEAAARPKSEAGVQNAEPVMAIPQPAPRQPAS